MKEVKHIWVRGDNRRRAIIFDECKACGIIRFGNNGNMGYISADDAHKFITTTKEVDILHDTPPCTGEVKYLIHWMLKGRMRDYVIKKIKSPLEKVIEIIGGRLPEITRESLLHPNSKILFDAKDKFFEYEENKTKKKLFEAAWKILIAEYEHDNYYRYRFDWLLDEIGKNWKPRMIDYPNIHWKESEEVKCPK